MLQLDDIIVIQYLIFQPTWKPILAMEPLQQLTLPKNMNKSFYQFRLFPRTNTFNNWIVFVLIILSFSFIIADDKIISDLTQPDKGIYSLYNIYGF